MARSFSRPATLYEPGIYAIDLDGFTRNDTEALVATFSVVDWPDVDPLFSVTVTWDTGDGAAWTFGGRPQNKDGTPATRVIASVNVPRLPSQGTKAAVASGTATLEVYVAFTSAVAIQAV